MAKVGKTVGVKAMGNGIEVRFVHGKTTLRPQLHIPATKANLIYADRLRKQIMDEIVKGTFDILAHFPDYKFKAKVLEKTVTPTETRTFKDWVDVWYELAERELEFSSIQIYKRHMKAYWVPVFGNMMPRAITNEMILSHLSKLARERIDPVTKAVKKGLGRKTQNNILIPLRGVFDLICSAKDSPPHPLKGVKNLKVQAAEPDPFTLQEVEIALADIRKKVGDEWADYFEFMAFAGLRNSEQIAVQWPDVDLLSQSARIHRVKVMAREKNRTKTNRERIVEFNSRAAAVIERQRARTQIANKEVFRNPGTGRPWHDEQVQGRVWEACLRRCKIRHRPPKELRDTSVTLALAAGADPWYVAKQHGHSLQVMQKAYAKFMPNADRGRNRAAINDSFKVSVGLSVVNDSSK